MENIEIAFNLDATMDAIEMAMTASLISSGLSKVPPAYRTRAIKHWKTLIVKPIDGQTKATNIMLGLIIEACTDHNYIDRMLSTIENQIRARTYEAANDD